MVTVMELPQTVRPQTPPEPLGPAANETEKLQVMIDVRSSISLTAITRSCTISRCKSRLAP